MAESTPILSLTELEVRRPINIGGKTYYMPHRNALSPIEMERIKRMQLTITEWGAREFTDEEVAELQSRLAAVVKVAVPDLEPELLSTISNSIEVSGALLNIFFGVHTEAAGEDASGEADPSETTETESNSES